MTLILVDSLAQMIRTLKAFKDKTRNIRSHQDSVSRLRFLLRSFDHRHVRLGQSHQSLGSSQPRWALVSSGKFRSCLYSYSVGAHWLTLTKKPRERKGSFFFTEIRAGLATFFAMAYIISVNATITSDTGGTCICPPESQADLCNSNTAYLLCVQEVKRDIVTATAAIAALGTFLMGLLANLPVALAPGMGLNAYFAYTVVGYHGSGMIPYSIALTAVFVEGFVFLGLTLLGIRQWLARALPASIKLATGTGIGLYLTLIGLTYSAGIGLVTGAVDTPMELAGCVSTLRDPTTGLCPSSTRMRNPTMWIGIFCGGSIERVSHAVSSQRRYHHWHPAGVDHFVASPHPSDLLSPYRAR